MLQKYLEEEILIRDVGLNCNQKGFPLETVHKCLVHCNKSLWCTHHSHLAVSTARRLDLTPKSHFCPCNGTASMMEIPGQFTIHLTRAGKPRYKYLALTFLVSKLHYYSS